MGYDGIYQTQNCLEYLSSTQLMEYIHQLNLEHTIKVKHVAGYLDSHRRHTNKIHKLKDIFYKKISSYFGYFFAAVYYRHNEGNDLMQNDWSK